MRRRDFLKRVGMLAIAPTLAGTLSPKVSEPPDLSGLETVWEPNPWGLYHPPRNPSHRIYRGGNRSGRTSWEMVELARYINASDRTIQAGEPVYILSVDPGTDPPTILTIPAKRSQS